MVYLKALGQGVLVLHSMEAVNELLVRRGTKYSSRASNQMCLMYDHLAVQHRSQSH
jgi:hypothetical protein